MSELSGPNNLASSGINLPTETPPPPSTKMSDLQKFQAAMNQKIHSEQNAQNENSEGSFTPATHQNSAQINPMLNPQTNALQQYRQELNQEHSKKKNNQEEKKNNRKCKGEKKGKKKKQQDRNEIVNTIHKGFKSLKGICKREKNEKISSKTMSRRRLRL